MNRLKILFLATSMVLMSLAIVAHAHDLPRCGGDNQENMWGCLDKTDTIRPYCDRLQGDINMRAYCYDGYRRKVSTWDQYKGYINDPCYVAPDTHKKPGGADCAVTDPSKTGEIR